MKPLLLLICCLLAACAGSGPETSDKFDAPLAKKISELRKAGDNQKVQVIARFNQAVDDQLKKAVAESGVSVESATGKICTLSGNAESLLKLAQNPAVDQIQLSQTRNLLNQ